MPRIIPQDVTITDKSMPKIYDKKIKIKTKMTFENLVNDSKKAPNNKTKHIPTSQNINPKVDIFLVSKSLSGMF